MAVRGSLATMAIEDVLDWIDRRLLRGSLTVERGAVTRVFHFDRSNITSVGSNVPGERLGLLLVQRGALTGDQLREAFRVQADTSVALGKILLMVGATPASMLAQTLVDKVEEALADTVSWTEGTFQFEEDEPSRAVSEFEIAVNLRSALTSAAKQIERRRMIRDRLPTDDLKFFVKEAEWFESPLPGLCDQLGDGRTFGELVLEHHGSRFAVGTALLDLLDRGSIAIDRRASARPEQLSEPWQLSGAARGRAAGGDRIGALDLVSRALAGDPENEDVRALQRELERAVFAELSRDLLAEFRVPKLLKSREELDDLELSDAERYLARRIDGRWDLLSLLRVAPLREVEALLTFKRLADRGIISL